MDTATIQQIPAALIHAGTGTNSNDRTVFIDKQIATLAASLATQGLINAPTVRPCTDGTYEIIDGECRTRAAKSLGWEYIACKVLPLDDKAARARKLAENTGRSELNPIDEARGYGRVMHEDGYSVAEVAALAGVTENKVTLALLLLNCCAELQDLIGKGIIGVRYAQAIGRRGLTRNFQLRAASELQANPAPTIQWFGRLLDELWAAQQAPDSMFDLDSLTLETVKASKQADPPLPGKQQAPMVAGTAVEIVQGQIAYWQGAADQWAARGHKRNAERCQDAAQGLQQVATALSAALPVATAPEPIVEPTEPLDPMPMLLAILAERQPKRETNGLQVEAYIPFRVKGKIQAQRCDGPNCRNLPAHRVTRRIGPQLKSELLCSECLECVQIGV